MPWQSRWERENHMNQWMKWIGNKWQSIGTLLLIELLLPGGTLLALMLWLYKNNQLKKRICMQLEKVRRVNKYLSFNLYKCDCK